MPTDELLIIMHVWLLAFPFIAPFVGPGMFAYFPLAFFFRLHVIVAATITFVLFALWSRSIMVSASICAATFFAVGLMDGAEFGGTCPIAIWAAVTIVPIWVWMFTKPARRAVVAGTCAFCGYDLTSIPSRICPECGRQG